MDEITIRVVPAAMERLFFAEAKTGRKAENIAAEALEQYLEKHFPDPTQEERPDAY